MGWTPLLLVVTPNVPATSLAELIRYARDNPGKLASRPLHRSSHLARESFDGLGRRPAMREHRDPRKDGKSEHTRLGHRGYVRRQARAVRSQRGDSVEPPRLNVFERVVQACRHDISPFSNASVAATSRVVVARDIELLAGPQLRDGEDGRRISSGCA
jgi:hypothetical protein